MLFINITVLLCAVLLWQGPAVSAEQISLEQVLEEAEFQAFDLRIAEYHLLAASAQVAEARSHYYPQLSARLGNEYVRVHGVAGNVVSVGDAILADNASGYKHSLTFSAQYTLYDFGRRSLNLEYAKGRRRVVELEREQILRRVRQQVVELYGQALKQQKRLEVQRLRQEALMQVYRFSERLQQAGRYGREAVVTAALELAAVGTDLQDVTAEFATILESLAFYTGRDYAPATTVLAEMAAVTNLDNSEYVLEQHPELLRIRQEIDQKRAELELVKRSRYPQVILTGSHRMFGSNQRRFDDSFSSLSSRDSRIVLMIDVPLFAGFRSDAQAERLRSELASLELQQQKMGAELAAEVRQRERLYRTLSQQESTRTEQQRLLDWQLQDLEHMTQQQLIDQVIVRRRQAEMSLYQLDIEIRRIDLAVQSLLLQQMMAGGQ
jgi:outer membrane protein TolC